MAKLTSDTNLSEVNINSLIGNVRDRRRDGLYDRVCYRAGTFTPSTIQCFQAGVGSPSVDGSVSFKTWNETNMLGNGQLNAPFEAFVRRFCFLFQPTCDEADIRAMLAHYTWEFWILCKNMQRSPLLTAGAQGTMADLIQDFGEENCNGKLRKFAAPYFYDLGEYSRYLPPLTQFGVRLTGQPVRLKADLDLYVIMDGTVDYPVQ